MKLTKMRFLARRETSLFRCAQCQDCSWSINSNQVNRMSYVTQNSREHTQMHGHTVEITTTRTITYNPEPKDANAPAGSRR